MKLFFAALTAAALIATSVWTHPTQAQENLPKVPAPIQNLVDEGAQIRYLGEDEGFDGWLTIKNGQEQYFYVTPDQKSFVMGLLFNDKGKAITLDQVQRLRVQEGDTLDALATDLATGRAANSSTTNEAFDVKSPSERLYYDIENSNWVPVGAPGAPVIYSFIDPQCPHCHSFMEDAKGEIEAGRLQVRVIPVGFRDQTRAQAAFLLAAPNPQNRWFRYMEGEEDALPAKANINQQGIQRNLAIMQGWDLNVTPMILYRSKDGNVKVVRGRPKDLGVLISDAQG